MTDPTGAFTIEIYSDVVCPWCFIGKRRLEKALSMLGNDSTTRVIWRPFQLNPGMPAGRRRPADVSGAEIRRHAGVSAA